MISIGWLLIFGIIAIILVLFSGKIFSTKIDKKGLGLYPLFGGTLILGVLAIIFFLKGTGYTASPSRLRADQVYWVIGYVENPRLEEDVIILQDFNGNTFCINSPKGSRDLAQAKTIQVAKNESGEEILKVHISEQRNGPEKPKESNDEEPESPQVF